MNHSTREERAQQRDAVREAARERKVAEQKARQAEEKWRREEKRRRKEEEARRALCWYREKGKPKIRRAMDAFNALMIKRMERKVGGTVFYMCDHCNCILDYLPMVRRGPFGERVRVCMDCRRVKRFELNGGLGSSDEESDQSDESDSDTSESSEGRALAF